MKSIRVLVVIGVALAMLFSAASVFASPATSPDLSASRLGGTPAMTPGAKATEKALHGKGKKEIYRGIVATVGSGSLSLTLADGSSQAFAVTADTKVKVPSLGRAATLADITPEMRVVVQARKTDAGLTALRIAVIPGRPTRIHRVGVVTAYTAGSSISIQDKDGNSFTFALTADTKILPQERAGQLAVGSRVTIISRRDVTGGPAAAQAIVVHPNGTGSGKPGAPGPEGTEAPETPEPPEASPGPA